MAIIAVRGVIQTRKKKVSQSLKALRIVKISSEEIRFITRLINLIPIALSIRMFFAKLH